MNTVPPWIASAVIVRYDAFVVGRRLITGAAEAAVRHRLLTDR